MPGGFTVGTAICNATNVSIGVNPTAGSSNVKGSWLLLGVVPYHVSLLHLGCIMLSSSTSLLADIGIGPSGSQVVLFPNLNYYSANTGLGPDFYVPVDIPAGTSVWVRTQSASAGNANFYFNMDVYSGDNTQQAGFTGGDSIGVSTGNSLGTLLTTSSTANVKGSYVQLTAAAQTAYSGLIICQNIVTGAKAYNIDIAFGASGSEVVVIPNMTSGEDGSIIGFIPVNVPLGTRIAARASSQQSGAVTIYASLIGVYK
jgi:hypothetical protein